jgi:xanthine dehydrogenase small subunit
MQVQRPQLKNFVHRFASLPVRNSGTLGGNVANGSPIGDSMPLLISLGATVSLARSDGVAIQTRDLPLEKLYLGYRKNVFLPDEVLTHIHVPKPGEGEFSRVYKVSKRFEDDISAVCLAIHMTLVGGRVQAISMGAGGVAAVPARAVQTEAVLVGKTWSEEAAHIGALSLQSEFAPISDMRASDAYRQAVLGQLMKRFWLETQGHTQVSLADITVIEELL